MPTTKYTQRTDGEGFEIPNRTPYKLACCDCGLVHRIALAAPGVKQGVGIGFASVRDNRATGQLRRRNGRNKTTANTIDTSSRLFPSGIEAIVCDDIAARQRKGIDKYGVTVANNALSLHEWLQHAYEEALDQAIYLKRAIAEIDKNTMA